jgi:hypothetical protein
MKAFKRHPEEVGMTYLQHLRFASHLSWLLFSLSLISLIHSVFPFLYTKTVSTKIKELHMELSKKIACEKCCCCKDAECKCEHKECCCKK